MLENNRNSQLPSPLLSPGGSTIIPVVKTKKYMFRPIQVSTASRFLNATWEKLIRDIDLLIHDMSMNITFSN